MQTLLLDRSTWDLVLDARGNLAVAGNPYSLAQDVSSAVRLFKGELWYDTVKGVPHFQEILGHQPSLPVMKAAIKAAAETVPEVVTATVFVSGVVKREVIGQIQITDSSGQTTTTSGGLKTLTQANYPLNLPTNQRNGMGRRRSAAARLRCSRSMCSCRF